MDIQRVFRGSLSKYLDASRPFAVDFIGLTESISRLVFTVSIDGPGMMGEISSHTASIAHGGQKQPAPPKVSLEKRLSQNAPKLVSLDKPLTVELRKRNLEALTARAALVLDISGSMSKRYSDGTVQEIVNKTLPLAVQFPPTGRTSCAQ